MHLLNDCFSVRMPRPFLSSASCSVRLKRFTLAAIVAASQFVLTTSPVGADEFSVVPANDPLYKHFAIVRRAGWNDSKPDASSNASRSTTATLTRYEMALETARAYLSISSLASRDRTSGALTLSRPAVRSLREMIVALRSELRSLDIDVNEALAFCDRVAQRGLGKSVANTSATGAGAMVSSSPAPSSRPRPRSIGSNTTASLDTPNNARFSLQLPISQKLRLHAALSSLVREAGDPFGDAATRSPHRTSDRSIGLRQRPSFLTGGAYEVTDWLRVRADYARREPVGTINPRQMLASNPAESVLSPLLMRSLNPAAEGRSLGGGIDIALSGLTFSGQVARISTNGAGADATRIGGGVALNAWQNRLALSANLSRLVPEDSAELSSQAAALSLDVGVTERLRLKLLYQQLFNSPTQNRGERIVAGGINISF